MKRESLIEMKVTPKNSNPAKNEVVENANSNDNALQPYLSEISAYPQLSTEEEVELAKRIEQGDLEAKQNFTLIALTTLIVGCVIAIISILFMKDII